MQASRRKKVRRASGCLVLMVTAGMLAACATPEPKAAVQKKPRSKEYFSETEYGVKASPYVGNRKLVGRDQIGKPYQVRGKWYYPKEEKKYVRKGTASWYGEAFHGRLTANGEVYNVADITAAHPTMPLPSYARVTNLANGSSVVVRVNDRGPYHDNRIIDLSKRAADMLGYSSVGTAQVKVEYIGRAPLEAHDEQYLVASYRPGNRAPDPSDGLPTGVMIAMNGTSPGKSAPPPVPFPSMPEVAPVPATMVADAQLSGFPPLPDSAPVARPRKGAGTPTQIPFAMASLNYAQEQQAGQGARAFAAFDAAAAGYVAAGTFGSEGAAREISARLAGHGRVEVEAGAHDGGTWYSVNLYPDGRGSLDELLRAAWSNGAADALAVRD